MRFFRFILISMISLNACAPARPKPTTPPSTSTIAVKGDWGAGTQAQRDVTAAMCAERRSHNFQVVITTGDNFYHPDGRAISKNYLNPERCLLDRGVTWRAVWGNHDLAGSSTKDVLGADHRYTWSDGEAQFFMLDSNKVDAAQTRWLERQLKSSTARLKIAVFHHRVFTNGPHEDSASIKSNWVPLFERWGVALVLTGHNHDYEHAVSNGVAYVVTGGGGAQVYPCLRREAQVIKCLPENHFLLLTFSVGEVTVEAIGVDGKRFDRFKVPISR